MQASTAHQQILLAIQAHDTRLGQIQHRKRNLAESALRESLVGDLAELNTAVVHTQTELTDLNREVTRAEDDVATVAKRAKRDQELIDSGSITNPKQLTELQHEVQTLAKRQSDLEDVELELMEKAEELSNRAGSLAEQIAAKQSELDEVSAREAELLAEIDAETASETAARESAAASIDTELLALYEKVRSTSGIGAAELKGGRCEGCHMQLAPTDLRTIEAAPADEVVRCEECRCILVRP